MDWEVLPSVWPAGNHTYRRGDVVPGDRFNPTQVDAFRRLGFIRPHRDDMLKKDLLTEAESEGVEIPAGATKAEIIQLLEA